MEKNRLEFIDIAKGMLIILMVIGHTLNIATYQPEANEFVKNVNFLETLYKGFYMCTFFVITGYCSNFNKPFWAFTKANLKTIVLPAFSFYFINQAINLLYARDFQIMDYLNFDYRLFFIKGLSAWFLAALFVARNIYWFVLRFMKSERHKFILFVILYILGYFLSHRMQNYWSFQQAFMFLFFLEYGQYLKGGGNCFTKFPYASFLVYIVAYVYTSYVSDNSIIGIHNSISLTKETLVSNLIIAVCGSNLALYIARIIGRNRLLQYFGKNSLIVYLLNWHVIVIAWDVLHPLLGADAFVNVICYASVLLLTMSFCAFLIYILNLKYIRLIIGKGI